MTQADSAPNPLASEQRARSALRAWSERHARDVPCIILCGYPKSGNTLTRFVYHNLIAVTNCGAQETLSYLALNAANPNVAFPEGLAQSGFREPRGIDHRGFPLMLHSHGTWEPFWRDVGRALLVVRDPLDALIGHWYTQVVFPAAPVAQVDVDSFVLDNLPDWIRRHRTNAAHADALLLYRDMLAVPDIAFGRAFASLGVRFEPAQLARAAAMSHFDRIREMEARTGQRHGHRSDAERNRRFGLAPWRDAPEVRFTRSGAHGQWQTALAPETVARARALLAAEGLADLLTPEVSA